MCSVTLLHPEETFKIPVLQVINQCSLFQKDPTLLATRYRVQSPVSLSIFREFISALEGNTIKITDTNFTELTQLSEEFGFSELATKLSEFRPSMDFKEAEDSDSRGRIAALEEKANEHDHDVEVLQNKVTQLSTDFGRLVSEVSSLRSASAGIQALSEAVSPLKRQTAQKLNDPVVEQLSTNFSELRKEVLTLKGQIAAMSLDLRVNRLLQLHSNGPFRRSIRGSFRTFRKSSQSSERSNFRFCGGAVAMVSKQKSFTADVTVSQTL
jgi:archaellum component FlaC